MAVAIFGLLTIKPLLRVADGFLFRGLIRQ